MLRLKQALLESDISQQAVVMATGFSKTQISLTLSSGKLPANEEKFKSGVAELARTTGLGAWLEKRGMNVERLFEKIRVQGEPSENSEPSDLAKIIYRLAGQATIDGGLSRGTALRLVKAVHFLSITALPQIAAEAAAILKGGAS